ncbi:MAG: tetratricopeptide repeat protein [Armatimonadota bacterium]|nr:tetratricopeptide repeat protein [Armatimonadota bacterium]
MKPIYGARLTVREAYVFRHLVSHLPDEVVDRHPWMARSGASSCRYVGDYERALAFARRSLAAAKGRDVNLWAFSTHGIGVMYTHLDRFHDAVEVVTRALERIDASALSTQIEPRMLAGLLTVLITARVQLAAA